MSVIRRVSAVALAALTLFAFSAGPAVAAPVADEVIGAEYATGGLGAHAATNSDAVGQPFAPQAAGYVTEAEVYMTNLPVRVVVATEQEGEWVPVVGGEGVIDWAEGSVADPNNLLRKVSITFPLGAEVPAGAGPMLLVDMDDTGLTTHSIGVSIWGSPYERLVELTRNGDTYTANAPRNTYPSAFRIWIAADQPAQPVVPVETVAPVLVLAAECGVDHTVSLPTVEGVEYVSVADAATGSVTVTAAALAGYEIVAGDVTWTFDVTGAACPPDGNADPAADGAAGDADASGAAGASSSAASATADGSGAQAADTKTPTGASPKAGGAKLAATGSNVSTAVLLGAVALPIVGLAALVAARRTRRNA